MIEKVTSTNRKLGKENLVLSDVYKKEIHILGTCVYSLERTLDTKIDGEDSDNKKGRIGFKS